MYVVYIFAKNLKLKQMTNTDKKLIKRLMKTEGYSEKTAKHVVNHINSNLILK